ncbi:hypothetical protein GCM10023107_03180 [Actinoplanes octamycinicus]|nr:hypothetical protein Aoc01nite_69800 [Actinoplanes octamycinicus]
MSPLPPAGAVSHTGHTGRAAAANGARAGNRRTASDRPAGNRRAASDGSSEVTAAPRAAVTGPPRRAAVAAEGGL